jgi:histidinol-phosphate/aromatic aminotransferase/cobyric acid decarboxylase-like protein
MSVSIATTARDREDIYRLRHDVYAEELEQYESRPDGVLPDSTDIRGSYIITYVDKTLAGFVGITPPGSPRYSVDKYFTRDGIPITFNNRLYEIRALTVRRPYRGSHIAGCLMYAAFRWIQARGGEHIMSMGRRDVVDMYLRLGLNLIGQSVKCGAITYDLLVAEVNTISSRLKQFRSELDRMERRVNWQLGITFRHPAECYHGGAFFDSIGDQFDDLNKRKSIINADVLDAWYPPAPSAQRALREHLPWIMRTSPPTRSNGLEKTIADTRNVEDDCILAGAGSSALIFLAFRHWLNPMSRVLVLDPTYGEYTHVLQEIISCRIERFLLHRSNGYRVDLELLREKLSEGFDLFVWVNPNSPTGVHVPKSDVEAVLKESSRCERVWIDETYVDYAGIEHSLEKFAAKSENVLVCKSLSKVYALSGLRVAYLCASPHQLESLRVITPPWSVSLPGQICATQALKSHDYYGMRYRETHNLRMELIAGLRHIGISEIIPGCANFVMFHLPMECDNARSIVKKCRAHGLYLRDAAGMGSTVGSRAIRIAVKDAGTNQRMLKVLDNVLALRASP